MGNPGAVKVMRAWADSWQADRPPAQRALILAGDPGIGKTTAAHALAHELGWAVIELNASDARNATAIEKVALRGAVYDSFGDDGTFQRAADGYRKLIILDEADSLVERVAGGRKPGKDLSDRGGKPAIVKTLRQTAQPIIIIVNDLYALTKGSGGPLKQLATTVRFRKLQPTTVRAVLAKVCQREGVKADPEALMKLAGKVGGDMRAALNDLQGLAEAGPITLERVAWLGSRDSVQELFHLLSVIFRSMSYAEPRRTAINVDENPEFISLWVDDNLPRAYQDPYDLQRGYEALSRADLFLGRVRRRQYYGFWSYASELSTSGVALAKKRPPQTLGRFQFPSWLRKMSASRGRRNLRESTLLALARYCHTSRDVALTELRPLVTHLLAQEDVPAPHDTDQTDDTPGADLEAPRDPRPGLIADLQLEDSQVAFLMGLKPTDRRVKELLEEARTHGWGAVEKLRGAAAREALSGLEVELPAAKASQKGKGKGKGKGKEKAMTERKAAAEETTPPREKGDRSAASRGAGEEPDGDRKEQGALDGTGPTGAKTRDKVRDDSQKSLFDF